MRAVTPLAPGSPPAGGATSGRRAGTGATFPAPPARPRWPRPAEGVERPGGAVGPARGTEQPRGRQPGTPHPGSAGRRHRAGRRPNRRATGPRPGSPEGWLLEFPWPLLCSLRVSPRSEALAGAAGIGDPLCGETSGRQGSPSPIAPDCGRAPLGIARRRQPRPGHGPAPEFQGCRGMTGRTMVPPPWH